MQVIIIELCILAILIVAIILTIRSMERGQRTLTLMKYCDNIHDINDPSIQELGLLLHGKREWNKRMENSKKIQELMKN